MYMRLDILYDIFYHIIFYYFTILLFYYYIMKLSRRGKHVKSTRRGRHTKRAGKHLRYRGKKVRASKRYSRGRGGGRVRTYKRGKRLQRGGELKFPESVDSEGFYKLTLPDRDLFFTKKGVFIQGDPFQKFKITLEVSDVKSLFQKDQSNSITSLFVVTFTRNNPNSKGQTIEHTIRNLSYFTNPENRVNTIAMIMNSKAEPVTTYYNFSDARNGAFFKEIQTCIIGKLIEELNKFRELLDGCKIRIFSLSIKDAEAYTYGEREYKEGLYGVCKCLEPYRSSYIDSISKLDEENILLSFFDCIYVNNTGGIDEDKTKQQVSFIPFHRLVMFTSVDDAKIKFDSNELMRYLRTELQKMMTQIIKKITELIQANDSNYYDIASNIIIELGKLVNRSIYRQFSSYYMRGSERSPPAPSLNIKSCRKIDQELAKFVIEKSKNKPEYRDYDGSVEYIPPDLIPAADPS